MKASFSMHWVWLKFPDPLTEFFLRKNLKVKPARYPPRQSGARGDAGENAKKKKEERKTKRVVMHAET